MQDKLNIEDVTKFVDNNLIIISCANYGYIRVAINWARHLSALDISGYIVFALDKKSYDILSNENINTLLFEIDAKDWGALMYYKMRIPYEILKINIDVLWSDLDAVWLRNPLEYINIPDCDIIGSIVEHEKAWPPTVREVWKFTICTGWIYFRNTHPTKNMLCNILEVTPFSSDQKVFNEYLLKQNPLITHMQDGSRLLKTDQFTIKVLSSLVINRGNYLKDLYVCHPLSEKNGFDTEKVLRREGLWYKQL